MYERKILKYDSSIILGLDVLVLIKCNAILGYKRIIGYDYE